MKNIKMVAARRLILPLIFQNEKIIYSYRKSFMCKTRDSLNVDTHTRLKAEKTRCKKCEENLKSGFQFDTSALTGIAISVYNTSHTMNSGPKTVEWSCIELFVTIINSI